MKQRLFKKKNNTLLLNIQKTKLSLLNIFKNFMKDFEIILLSPYHLNKRCKE